MTVLTLLVGCGKPSEPAGPPAGQSTAAKGSPSAAGRSEQPTAELGVSPVVPSTTSDMVRAEGRIVFPTVEWTPQLDVQHHAKYHWPATFELPIVLQLDVPATPPEVAEPAPPIKHTPEEKKEGGFQEMLRRLF
jgi:hypothetical protein